MRQTCLMASSNSTRSILALVSLYSASACSKSRVGSRWTAWNGMHAIRALNQLLHSPPPAWTPAPLAHWCLLPATLPALLASPTSVSVRVSRLKSVTSSYTLPPCPRAKLEKMSGLGASFL